MKVDLDQKAAMETVQLSSAQEEHNTTILRDVTEKIELIQRLALLHDYRMYNEFTWT